MLDLLFIDQVGDVEGGHADPDRGGMLGALDLFHRAAQGIAGGDQVRQGGGGERGNVLSLASMTASRRRA